MEKQWCLKDGVPFAVMVLVECCEVGMITLSKAAMNGGMSNFVYVVYYNSLGTLLLLPSFVIQRNRNDRLPITFQMLCRFFVLGLIGVCLLQIFMYTGIKFSSPTLATALGNLIPGFTFLLAIIFKMEKIDMRKLSSQAKTAGTIVAVTGAFVMTLYKGPAVIRASLPFSSNSVHHHLLLSPQSDWILGGLILVVTCFLVAAWTVLQAVTVEEFPEGITVVFFSSCFGSVSSAIFALIAERNPDAWILRPDMGMIAIVFSAFFGCAIRSNAITWCLHKKGPVYVAMFKPLAVIISAITGILFLGDVLYLGSVIGAVVIAAGFYAVTWAQANEKVVEIEDIIALESESSKLRAPLLPN